jgi:hypothetical protein
MPGEVQTGGGFNSNPIRARMSEQLQRRLAAEDAREAQQAAEESRRPIKPVESMKSIHRRATSRYLPRHDPGLVSGRPGVAAGGLPKCSVRYGRHASATRGSIGVVAL